MGMPEISIIFKKLAETAKSRSQRGVVAIITTDTTVTGLYKYKRKKDVKEEYNSYNLALINRCFETYGVKQLIIASSSTIADGLALLKKVKFNYLIAPKATEEEKTTIATFIKARRSDFFKSKAILTNLVSDDKAIINFIGTGIKRGLVNVDSGDFTVDLACVLATLPLGQSATYHVFPDITGIDDVDNPDEKVDAGQLFLINDGDKIKLSRAVNSMTTINGEDKEDMKKIKIVDDMDFIYEDIYSTFENNYVGKVDNSYNNKMLFFDDINDYLKSLTTPASGVLDPDGTNTVEIDIESQRKYLEEEKKIDTTDMTDTQVLHYNTDTHVFGSGTLSFIDAMEDLALVLYH